MKRREVLWGLMGLAGAGAAAPQRVATLSQFPEVWSRVRFEFAGKPALVVRVPGPEASAPKALEASPGFFLAAYLLECPHNGCTVRDYPQDPARLVCYCHGSRFWARDGSLEAGIANADLPRLELRVLEGSVYVVTSHQRTTDA